MPNVLITLAAGASTETSHSTTSANSNHDRGQATDGHQGHQTEPTAYQVRRDLRRLDNFRNEAGQSIGRVGLQSEPDPVDPGRVDVEVVATVD